MAQHCQFTSYVVLVFTTDFLRHHTSQHTHTHDIQTRTAAGVPPTSEEEARTDRQKEREQQSASAYQWRVGAECSPAAPRLPAALSTSPADAGPPRSRSCPSTTGNPVESTAHLLRKAGPCSHSACVSRAPLSNKRLCLLAVALHSTK